MYDVNKLYNRHCVYSCVIAEMFGGGVSLFDLSTLLEYRNGENPPNLLECIKRIEEKAVRVNFLLYCTCSGCFIRVVAYILCDCFIRVIVYICSGW